MPPTLGFNRMPLPAGVGHAVNLTVDVGKERDSQLAGWSLAQKLASHAPTTKRRLSFGVSLCRWSATADRGSVCSAGAFQKQGSFRSNRFNPDVKCANRLCHTLSNSSRRTPEAALLTEMPPAATRVGQTAGTLPSTCFLARQTQLPRMRRIPSPNSSTGAIKLSTRYPSLGKS